MKLKYTNTYLTIYLSLFIAAITLFGSFDSFAQMESNSEGAFYTGKYSNLFSELLDKNEREVKVKINFAFNQLFYGNDSTERIYYPVGEDMAYIEDVLHNDVRSEGMSYGMMIAVQLNKKKEFDCLWKWAKTYMQHKTGPAKNYFAWQLTPEGKIMDSTTASDGEEWIVTALFLASERWGDGEGIFNYGAEAQILLDAMLNKKSEPENDGIMTGIFDKKEKQVVFVPEVQAANFTDPSYHLPHFYELWAKWAKKDNQFWADAADTSRQFLKRATHPKTGLAPDYAEFDGTPKNPWGGGNHNFQYDAFRVAMNVAVDYEWFRKDEWAVKQSNRLLEFFYSQGMGTYGNIYTVDGKKLNNDHSTGLLAMNAVAALAATTDKRKEFVEELWKVKIPTGQYRYYDSVLYMLGLLQVSGNFRVYGLP